MARPKKARKVCFEPNIAELIKQKTAGALLNLLLMNMKPCDLLIIWGLPNMNVHCKWKSLVQPLPQFMKMQDTRFPIRS